MAIKIGSNFTFQGQQPNFERDRFATKAAMKAFPETSIDDGHLSYCAEDGNTYQFKSSNNVDTVTGKWRVFKADVDLSKYVTKDAMNTALNKKVDIKGKFVYSDSNVKIATINVENFRYATSTFSIDIRCRRGNILTVNIAVNTDGGYEGLSVAAFKNTIGNYSATEKVYYYIDKSDKDNYKVIVFYKNDLYDSILGKITGASTTTTTSCTLNMEAATELPEGVVEIMDVGYGNKNLFYSTPKDAAGNPTFRAIDVADLPDLSSKYATKEKAFTKDTVSTEPGQFVAGPATTQGNLYLRKLIADDIPDLKSKYQPKYNADYIATSDISTLPITTGVIDLNGNQIDLPNIDLVDGYLTIMNGIVVFNATTTNLRVKELELSNVTISYSDDVNTVLDIQKLECLNVVDTSGLRINFTEGSAIKQATLINSSIRAASLSVTETLNMHNSTCNINGNVKLTAYNSFVGDDGLSLANGSAWYNTQLDISPYYTSGWVDETGKMHCGMFFDDTITGDSDYAPQTKAVYNALQLKADKTQLASLATQTDFVDLRNKVNAMPKTVFITQAAYNALTTKDANTIYYING